MRRRRTTSMESAYSLPGLRPPPNVRYVTVMGVFSVTLVCVLYYLYKIHNPASGPIEYTFSAKFIAVESNYQVWESHQEDEARSRSLGGHGESDSRSGSEYNNTSKGYDEKYDQFNSAMDHLSASNEPEKERNRISSSQTVDDFRHTGLNSDSSKTSWASGTTKILDGSFGRDDLTGEVKSLHDRHPKSPPPLSADFINAINMRYMSQWKAGRNFPATSSWPAIVALVATFVDLKNSASNDQIFNLTWENIHVLRPPRRSSRMTTFFSTGNESGPREDEEMMASRRAMVVKDLPTEFDARDAWLGCPSIGQLRDQGRCGSDWAEAPAAVISDRLCIHREEYFRVSGYDLLTCCSSCGLGCSGGTVEQAFIYYMNIGIVSGGPFGSNSGCKPDLIGPSTFASPWGGTPNCSLSCHAGSALGSSSEYWWARQTGYIIYRIVEPLLVRWDLVNNGPLVAVMDVYEDFLQYRTGVYQRVLGGYVGHHAVKVVGYGSDEGVSYYLCANSWGPEWGDKGFFKISTDGLYNFIVGY